MKKVVFVCLGNICRSPLAEGIARAYVAQRGYEIEVDSAGTSGYHDGEPPHHYSIDVARKHGMDIRGLRSSRVSAYMEADLFVAMDSANVADLLRLGIESSKVVKVGEYGLDGADIPDPYYKGIEGFDEVYEMLEVSVKRLLDSLNG